MEKTVKNPHSVTDLERSDLILSCENCGSRFLVDPKLLEPRGRRVRCARCKHVWFQAPAEADTLSGDANMQAAGEGEDRRQIFRRAPQEAAQDSAPFSDPAPTEEPVAAPVDEEGVEDEAAAAASAEDSALYDDDPSGSAGDKGDDESYMPDLPWNSAVRNGKAQVPAVYKERSPLLMAAGWIVLAALVLSALGGLVLARETIAAKIPATKPVYAAVGLAIEPKVIVENVGRYLKLETPPPPPADLRDGMIVQEITGTITNIADAPVKIPTLEGILRDRDNKELYRWLFSAEADILYPGQRAAFATEIVDMPEEAVEMELVFAEGRMPKAAARPRGGYESSR
ncbi:MAG: zinc-ribbon domain-containing protein [Pseudomonadota bacterium]